MSRLDKRWILTYSLLLVVVTALPYLLGFASEADEWAFSGFVFGVEDGNSYIAKMLSGSYGAWVFRTPYTLEPQHGELIFLPYLLLGKLAAPPALHIQLVVLYHLFRLINIPLLVYAIYQFTGHFLHDVMWRRWVVILATVGGGLGWLLPVLGSSSWLGSLPLDFISPETFGFLAILGLPHLVLARALMFLALHLYLVAGEKGSSAWEAGVILIGLTLIQSLSTLSTFAVILTHQGLMYLQSLIKRTMSWREKWLPVMVQTLLPASPVILYFVIRFSTDRFLLAWTAQNRILSPHPLHYLLAFGVFLVPLLFASRKRPWRDQGVWFFILGWILALPVLVYFPHNLQRRLVEGAWIAILLFAAFGLSGVVGSWSRIVMYGLGSISLISSLFIYAGSIHVALNPAPPAFIPLQRREAFSWMVANVPKGSAVLADYETSNALPAWAPVRVPIGHGPESLDLDELRPAVDAFYAGDANSEARYQLIHELGIDYVYLEESQASSWALQADGKDYLTEVYQNNGTRLYEVSDHEN
jgi:hypothetical protein